MSSIIMTVKILELICPCLLLHTYTDLDFSFQELSLFYSRAFVHPGMPQTKVPFFHISLVQLKCFLSQGSFPNYSESPCSCDTYFWFGSYMKMLFIMVNCETYLMSSLKCKLLDIRTMAYSFYLIAE